MNKGFGLACTYLPSGLSRLLFFVLMALASDPSSRKNTRAVAGQTYIRLRGKVQKMALERNSYSSSRVARKERQRGALANGVPLLRVWRHAGAARSARCPFAGHS